MRHTRFGLRCGFASAAIALTLNACTSSKTAESPPGPSPQVPHATVAAHIGIAQQFISTDQVDISPPGKDTATPVAMGEQALAIDLLRQVGTDGNVAVSPASLAIALAMLENGASGTTRDEIATSLYTRLLDDLAQNRGWQALTSAWAQAAKDDGVTLETANSLWQASGLPIKREFLSALAAYYGAGVWQVDFANDMTKSLDAINRWTAANTHGKITKLFDKLDPSTQLVLANAVYFKAAWADPFDPDATSDGPFVRSDGAKTTASFMTKEYAQVVSAASDNYIAAQLPYKGGRFAAVIVMPRHRSLAELLDELTLDELQTALRSLHSQLASLRLPKFTVTSTIPLNNALQALGIRQAFADDADFSGLSSSRLHVDQVLQRVYLKVGEKGTEAAAATGIGVAGSGAPGSVLELTFDHPFLFLIRDTETGAILFASEIQDPTAG